MFPLFPAMGVGVATHFFRDGVWTPGANLPQARRELGSAAISETEFLVCGGKSVPPPTPEVDCWVYDQVADAYMPKASLPTTAPEAAFATVTNSNGDK